jgi:hypothetical protein
MTKQVIHVQGEDHVVREDTAKSFRGVYWALISVAAFIVIAAILFFSGIFTGGADGIQSPAEIEQRAR